MKKQDKKIHIDNLYLTKQFNEEYQNEFNRFYNYVLSSNNDNYEVNIMVNITIDKCLDCMKQQQKFHEEKNTKI